MPLREHFYITTGVSAEAICAQADTIRRDTHGTPRASTVHHHSYTLPCTDHNHDEYETIGEQT